MDPKKHILQLDATNASQAHRKTAEDSWHLTTHGIQIFENKGLVEAFAPNRLDFYVVALNRHGSAQKTIGLLDYAIQPMTLHFLAQGVVHTLTQLSEDIDGFYICFTPEFYYRYCVAHNHLSLLPFYQHEGIPLFQLPATFFDPLEQLFQQIHQEQTQPQSDGHELMWTYLHQIHLLSHRFYKQHQTPSNLDQSQPNPSALVQRFKKLVDKYFVEKKLVADYADELLISPNICRKWSRPRRDMRPCFGSTNAPFWRPNTTWPIPL